MTLVDREEEDLDQVEKAIGGDRVATFAADVSKKEDVERFVDGTIERFGGLGAG